MVLPWPVGALAAVSDPHASEPVLVAATPAIERVLNHLGYRIHPADATALSLGQMLEEGRRTAPLLELRCAATRAWDVTGDGQDEAALILAMCDERLELSAEVVRNALQAQERAISLVRGVLPANNASMFDPYALQTEQLASGDTSRYFGVVLADPGGMLIVPTLMLSKRNGTRAVIVRKQLPLQGAQSVVPSPEDSASRVGLPILRELR